MSDFWKTLQIEPTKEVQVIKQAYALLAKKYHPEQYPKEFLNLRNAYEEAVDYALNGEDILFDFKNTDEEQESIADNNIHNSEEELDDIAAQESFWDLSKLNDENQIDCTSALSQFWDLYKSKDSKNADKWYKYFTSYDFLQVWREENFAKQMFNSIYENMEEFPINTTFAKCLNAVYGCIVTDSYAFDMVQYSKYVLFDGFSYISKIVNLCSNGVRLLQNDLSMFISFCEYRILISFAEENLWSDTAKINTEYILHRYVMAYIRERYEKNKYSDVDRYYLGIRLITNFVKKYNLPKDIYQYIWKNYSLDSAVNGRSKIYYGEIKEIILEKNKSSEEKLNQDYKKVYDLYYAYQRNLAKEQIDTNLIEEFFVQPETKELLKDRHFIYDTVFYWLSMPHHLSFLNKLYDFYSENSDVYKSDQILEKIKNRKKEISAENALKEDKKNKNYSMCKAEHRPFLRYWLNIGFYRAVNFSDVLKDILPFSEKWADAFGNKNHKLSLGMYRNKSVEVQFHKRYAQYFYGGKEVYRPFLQWYALEKTEDDTLFFLLLPAVIPFIDDEETYNNVLAVIESHFKNIPLPDDYKTQLSKGIVKMFFCGKYILEEIDDLDDEFYYDCNEYEFYRENETNLYLCSWSKYTHLMCFYEQKISGRTFMPSGVYENVLTEEEAFLLAEKLLSEQCSKSIVNISRLRILPEYINVNTKQGKIEKSLRDEITEELLISCLERFAENNVSRVNIGWLSEEIVLINTENGCACFYFNDKKYTTCKLLSKPEIYYNVDSKDVVHLPFLLGTLAEYEIFDDPKTLIMELCPLLFLFGEGNVPANRRADGMYVWSQNVYLYGKYDAYLLDKMKLGGFTPKEIMTEHNIKQKIIIRKFPNFIETAKTDTKKQKTDINPSTKYLLQTYLQMYLQGSIKYLHLYWLFKENSGIHIFLLNDENKYALYYLNDKSNYACFLKSDVCKEDKPEICNLPVYTYGIHNDIIKIRFFLALFLDNIENAELILNKTDEFEEITKFTYDDIYNKLIEIC